MPRALYRALAKPLPRARTALGKEKKPSGAGAIGGFFAEGRPSANKFFYFFLKNLCRGPPLWPSAKKFSGLFKNSLPRAGPRQRNGFFEFFLTLCRGPAPGPSAKKLSGFFSKKIFAEGYCLGPRQRTLVCRGPWSLPSAKRQKFKFFFVFLHSIVTSISYIYIYIYINIYITQNPFSHNISQP